MKSLKKLWRSSYQLGIGNSYVIAKFSVISCPFSQSNCTVTDLPTIGFVCECPITAIPAKLAKYIG
ncbi:Uncharacterised protein [Serratia entomophila]|nr:Uncharacterised protein [Serratia entomophila]CAI0823827.1 Uncharacterised protein [Serratia entomophila]CAI0828683.1 Uncharacterised protein [Serratia entomophila]CAI0844592.1 Uncharacterised protein [Serratia entomophila]CAI0876982.1 Uncharacterised protein [Serratia entomophila]